eukprot:CAMPEP_0175977544 /NCGR_PEP_ID=MMETSP0108-20121206/45138_1 /TAXON_ID=195067 ORGANISM="Goniomonas pacifica, Strain CCMP1869" /NCGR_SAMPLE_ID=MMETSP0108 /ASSEMBLY_ACC=CAM_ASM_000204 /LENGTH=88 /DNA_ID=CAMNT_0017307573 /DNA_START=148 /DNA_END=415 /DNA_ORIENTATION=-
MQTRWHALPTPTWKVATAISAHSDATSVSPQQLGPMRRPFELHPALDLELIQQPDANELQRWRRGLWIRGKLPQGYGKLSSDGEPGTI